LALLELLAVLAPIHPIAGPLASLVLALVDLLAVLVPGRPKPNLDVVIVLVLEDGTSGFDGAVRVFLLARFFAPMLEDFAKRTAKGRKLLPAAPGENTEIANARAKEREQKRSVLFPIALVPFDEIRKWKCFDADMGKDSAREVREFFIPDFSNWKDEKVYKPAFERLLKDLRTRDAVDRA
jgi:hypothetical protein